MELFSTLGINWQLFVVQIINFTILIVVLTYVLYRPILRILDERRLRVERAMKEAEDLERQKRDMDSFRAEQMRKLDQESSHILEEAKKQAQKVRAELLEVAKQEADQLLAKSKQQMEDERRRLVTDVQQSLAGVVVKLTAKMLEREFSSSDQQRIVTALEKDIPVLLR